MIDREHALSVTKQAQAVGIARSTVYYLPRAVSPEDLALMKRIDKLHTELPFAGSRMLRRLLVFDGCKVGRRHVNAENDAKRTLNTTQAGQQYDEAGQLVTSAR